MKNHKKGIAFATLTALLWGFLAILIKVALNKANPVTIVWVRMTVAMFIVGFYYCVYKREQLRLIKKPPLLLWVAAIGLALNYVFYAKGIEYAGPATSQVVIQLGSVMLCLFGLTLFKEHFVLRQIIGFLLTFSGLFFFYRQQLSATDFERDFFVKGVIFIVIAASSWTLYGIAQKKLVEEYPVQLINLFLYTFASVAYLPFVQFSDFKGLSIGMWLLLIALGLNTLIAYGSVGAALKHTDAGKVSVILILNPIITFATLGIIERLGFDWFVFENIPFWAYIGAVMMLTGAVLATLPPKKRVRKNPTITLTNS